MPLARRKKVGVQQDDPAIADPHTDPSRAVFYLPQTGEIFLDYESYAARLSFYRLKVFQCEVTGKGGLNYFEALESERAEARTLHARFPEQLRATVLRAVQWQIVGRLDHLVEAVYERFKDRYFEGERVFVDLQGEKYWARIVQVFPPKRPPIRAPSTDSATPPSNDEDPPPPPVHRLEGDLKVPAAEANKQDDPKAYFYKVQLIEEGHASSASAAAAAAAAAGTAPPGKGANGTTTAPSKEAKWSGSFMEVQCGVMSRDRLAFSKSILRRFIRDCVDRDSAVASPWTVKKEIAEKYGIDVIMPEATRKGVELVKRGEIEKRKKAWEDKEGPPSKKQKKLTAEEKGVDLPASPLSALLTSSAAKIEEDEAALREKKLRDEKQRQATYGTKKIVKFPTEDLDIVLTDKEKAAGKQVRRPPLIRDLPFPNSEAFEQFLMSWNFMVTFGKPLNLSTFTLDEYENALRHSSVEVPCALISEIHTALIFINRGLPAKRHCAVVSLLELKTEDEMEQDGVPSIDELVDALTDFGNGWERTPLRQAEGREGWEDTLVGCLKDHATTRNFPRLREILTRLTFGPEESSDRSSSDPSTSPSPPPVRSTPHERYPLLAPADKVAILSFMCDLAVTTKPVHVQMENAEGQLTELRKQKIEVNRERKKAVEELSAFGDAKYLESSPVPEGDTSINDAASNLSDIDSEKASDAASDVGSSTGRAPVSRTQRGGLRAKAQAANAKQREEARNKNLTPKQVATEQRRLDDEIAKLDKKLETIELRFRQLLGVSRLKPLGKDRFHNKVWWFDGLGEGQLVSNSGAVSYGAGRIFVQGPSQADMELMERKVGEDIPAKRLSEEGDGQMLGVAQWGFYADVEDVEEYVEWLNPKGNRELALKTSINRWIDHVLAGVKKRVADIEMAARLPEARRSTRKSGAAENREPYLLWTNTRKSHSSTPA